MSPLLFRTQSVDEVLISQKHECHFASWVTQLNSSPPTLLSRNSPGYYYLISQCPVSSRCSYYTLTCIQVNSYFFRFTKAGTEVICPQPPRYQMSKATLGPGLLTPHLASSCSQSLLPTENTSLQFSHAYKT